ncbi:cellulose biosynthesis protein BcsQ [Brevibacillus aydinogluensis]|jgi:cellulose biosynthesis protein BcsQ|uniref:AAA family ATPase n=1 Tax=Brevibacillus aydinogluensis TaxID=927786 RepID=UPI002892C8DD|nr:AAA family ATPase [Brevibacillus aydinogluensis]MDT3418135.1 cellulose biosynthesis protein BcsQ [Brevibacillus aydinogluensis]
MGRKPVFLVIDNDASRGNATVNALSPMANVFTANRAAELQKIKEREGKIDALFVSSEVDHLVAMCEKLVELTDRAQVYVVGSVQLSMVRKLFAAGVTDILASPIDLSKIKIQGLELSQSVPSAEKSADEREKLDFGQKVEVTTKRIIAVSGVKGGDGKTSTAAQLGMYLSRKGLDVLLIDTDFTGNAARWLRMDTINSISEFADQAKVERFDRDSLESKLVTHKQTNLKVLPSPIDGFSPVTSAMLSNAIQAYKPYYSIIIIDLHQGYNPLFDVAKDFATDILFLTVPDVERLERTKGMAQQIADRGVDLSKVKVIVNKSKGEEDLQKIRIALKNFGFQIFTLPFSKEFSDSNPVPPLFRDPKLPYVKAFQKLIAEGLGFKLKSSPNPKSEQATKKKKKSAAKGGPNPFSNLLAKLPFFKAKTKEVYE